jgi:competence protein ComEC
VEVYFADVGQGTSNVVLLGGRRAVVIDCGGMQSLTVLKLLQFFGVDELTRLVISHNDADHVGAAVAILTAYQGRIGRVFFLQDHKLQQTEFWARVNEQIQAGRLRADQLQRLERKQRPEVLFRDAGTGGEILILAPTFVQNLHALGRRDANATSGIVLLRVGARKVVFAGDSTISQWRQVRAAAGRPVHCDALATSHHGGTIWRPRSPGEADSAYAARVAADLDWLYSDAVRPDYAVISVGSRNQHRHPDPKVMQALLRAGVLPVCTQITPGCANDLESLRPGVLIPLHPPVPGRSSPSRQITTKAQRSKNVACAGTIVADITEDHFEIRRLAEHQAAVDHLPHPLCRPRAAS